MCRQCVDSQLIDREELPPVLSKRSAGQMGDNRLPGSRPRYAGAIGNVSRHGADRAGRDPVQPGFGANKAGDFVAALDEGPDKMEAQETTRSRDQYPCHRACSPGSCRWLAGRECSVFRKPVIYRSV